MSTCLKFSSKIAKLASNSHVILKGSPLVHFFHSYHPGLGLNFGRQTGHNSCASTAATRRPATVMDKRPL